MAIFTEKLSILDLYGQRIDIIPDLDLSTEMIYLLWLLQIGHARPIVKFPTMQYYIKQKCTLIGDKEGNVGLSALR